MYCDYNVCFCLQISATDQDMGLNGRVRYALASGIEAFAIDPTTGVVRSAKQLDRESTAYYDIIALGIDRGTPALTSEVRRNNGTFVLMKEYELIVN